MTGLSRPARDSAQENPRPSPPAALPLSRREARPSSAGRSRYCAGSSALRPGFLRISQDDGDRSEEHTSELQSLMRISYAVFCLKKKKKTKKTQTVIKLQEN